MSHWTVERKETLESKATQRELLAEGVRSHVKKTLEDLLEMILEEQRKERSRYGPFQRNGFYMRTLGTAYGVIEQLAVPRVRSGRFEHNMFAPFQRRDQDLDLFLTKLFLQGESYRDLQRFSNVVRSGIAPRGFAQKRNSLVCVQVR